MKPTQSLPDVLKRADIPSGAKYELRIAPHLQWFDGHFPGNPVLPGVVQIHWAIHFGADLGFDPARFRGLRRVKFRQIVRPGTILSLELKSRPGELAYSYRSDSTRYSEGTIEFDHE